MNVGDPEVGLLKMGCADALVLRQESFEDDVLEPDGPSILLKGHTALRRSRRVSSSYRNSSGSWPGLIRAEFICVLRSERFPRTAVKRSAKGGPRALSVSEPSSSVLPAKRRTTEHAHLSSRRAARCTSSRWPCSRPPAWNRRCLSPQMILALPVGLRKRPCRRC